MRNLLAFRILPEKMDGKPEISYKAIQPAFLLAQAFDI
jgi:hypothetical protein